MNNQASICNYENNGGMQKILLTIIFLLIFATSITSVPIVHDISVQGGERGIIVIITADSTFKADIQSKILDKKEIKITFNNALYGVQDYFYTQFSNIVPIRSVSYNETVGSTGGILEISLPPSVSIVHPIPVMNKKTKWAALISKDSVERFHWRIDPKINRNYGPATLLGVQMLQRGEINRLVFDLNVCTENAFEQRGDTIFLHFENTSLGDVKKHLVLPDSMGFKTVMLQAQKEQKKLTATILYDSTLDAPPRCIPMNFGKRVVVFGMQKKRQKLAFWTDKKGEEWTHDFITPEMIAQQEEKTKVPDDSDISVTQEPVFALGEITSKPSQPTRNNAKGIRQPSDSVYKATDMASPHPKLATASAEETAPVIKTSLERNASLENFLQLEKEEVPQARMISYHTYGRDPFLPILKDSLDGYGQPKAENLKLVGVLFDNNERIALIEDKSEDNKAYAFRVGDPIYHGKVLRVYKEKVVFLVTEFGISRSITVQMSKNSIAKK